MQSTLLSWVILACFITCLPALGQTSASVTNALPNSPAVPKRLSPEEIQVKIKELQQKAEKGDPAAQVQMGNLLGEGRLLPKNIIEATKWYRKSAEQGYAPGQFDLGIAYEHGEGVKTNYASAIKWYAKAAKQGFPPAQYNLGLIYIKGGKVRKNITKGAKLVHQAALQNDRLAQICLASLYLNGNGYKTNTIEACAWLGVVAKNEAFKNDQRVQYNYTDIQFRMNPDQIAEANRKTESLVADIEKNRKPVVSVK